MHDLAFRIVNVFTQNGGRLTGNPLCVFENATPLESQTMQALARQFNLAETTFILPSSRATAQVRIFTPSYEMQFAGHPTLGTAHVCRALGLGGDDLKLDMQAGIIPVQAKGDRWTLQAHAPTWRECEASRATLAKMLGLKESDIGREPLLVKAGKEQLIIPLTSESAVRNAKPDAATFAGVLNEDKQSMAYIFAELAQPGRLLSRFFFPVGGAVIEDPATGSATANLGGWMVATGRKLPCHFEISQGEYAGRPSTMLLDVDREGRIFVSGDVIELARGTLHV
jgi:PhzF family phenazine biosynthesis protein